MQKNRRTRRPMAAAVASVCLVMAFDVSARDLAHVDALQSAAPAARAKSAPATPNTVKKMTRDERLGIPTFMALDPQKQPSVSTRQKSAQDAVSAARSEFKFVAHLYGVSEQELDEQREAFREDELVRGGGGAE